MCVQNNNEIILIICCILANCEDTPKHVRNSSSNIVLHTISLHLFNYYLCKKILCNNYNARVFLRLNIYLMKGRSKGLNAVIAYIDHFLDEFSLGQPDVHFQQLMTILTIFYHLYTVS